MSTSYHGGNTSQSHFRVLLPQQLVSISHSIKLTNVFFSFFSANDRQLLWLEPMDCNQNKRGRTQQISFTMDASGKNRLQTKSLTHLVPEHFSRNSLLPLAFLSIWAMPQSSEEAVSVMWEWLDTDNRLQRARSKHQLEPYNGHPFQTSVCSFCSIS